ncbi:chemotaxis protein CheD [Sphingomonas sp. 1P06PA]|uniref:chemotaxis protein CheD n=1 Tax=Sphingomonas sp. 1P06PA TaxID=554121 RepID=UPI0039A54572
MLIATHERPVDRRHNVLQGEYEVSRDPQVTLTTVLGSCIACCLFDPVSGIGGMNHFLLPMPPEHGRGLADETKRYGLYAMEILVNAMLKRGATRPTMRAHLYGGANLHAGMRAIGTDNANFARGFLRADAIMLVKEVTGGTLARRLDLQPATGRVRCRQIAAGFSEPARAPVPALSGEVELF